MWFTKARRAANDTDDETWVVGRVSPTLNRFENTTESRATLIFVDPERGPRRITPVEAERLQGFPDNWTLGSILRGAEQESIFGTFEPIGSFQSDSARFVQMGNAVAVPVAEWVIRRLVEVNNALSVEEA